ncbi:MAG: glycosyltransferase family 2 protein [Nanoarchaeota archaeon]
MEEPARKAEWRSTIDLSIVIPAYNEEQNIPLLASQIKKAVDRLRKTYEIIFIDDGSRDNTFAVLKRMHELDPEHVHIIRMRKNFGQTAAFDAGFKHARGKIIITMDADLQNDPEDILLLLNKMKEGYDVVSGWRWQRKDPFSKKMLSKFANLLRRIVTKENIHDSGCSLKAYKRECFSDLNLYGEMHRYIPAILQWKGFRIGEVKVHHRQRKYGKTKYSFSRVLKGFLDLLVVKFWMQYSSRPMHLFGTIGIFSFLLGIITSIYLTIMKFLYHQSLANRPLLLLAILLMIMGIQFIIFGFLGDMLMKIYYDRREESNYNIKQVL